MSNYVLDDLNKAIEKLDEVLKLEKTEVVRDSAIKRFEICFDLAWKAIKFYAKDKGMECYSPKDCFKTAFQLGLINYDEQWLKMVDDRNVVTHLYSEKEAETVYSRSNGYLEMLKNLQLVLNHPLDSGAERV